MSRHLLVPMDDSGRARAALEHALSTFPDAEVTVVHAVDDLEAHYGDEAAAARDGPAFFADVERLADEHGRPVRTEVLDGPPAATILEYVRAEDVDAVVMGSRGRSGVSRMLLGSVAERVARRAPIPVTIV